MQDTELRQYKKKVVRFFLDNNMLVSPDFIDQLNGTDNVEQVNDLVKEKIHSEDFFMMNSDVSTFIEKGNLSNINWKEFEKSKALHDRNQTKAYGKFLDLMQLEEQVSSAPTEHLINITYCYNRPQDKKGVEHFVHHFNERYKAMERMLSSRPELTNLLPISRVLQKKDRDTVSIIGMVSEKRVTKNGHLIIELEDASGSISVLVSKNKEDMLKEANDIVFDEVIGIQGTNNGNIIFANTLLWPDVPNNKELKKSPDEVYAVFLSDVHVGSKDFLEEEFLKFIKWVSGKTGSSEQQETAKKVKYLFISGDVVDGVGIYPGQEADLSIPDIYDQYKEFARLLDMIPKHIAIVVCPGNHDALRIAEPQPVLSHDYCAPIYALENVYIVSNPAIVTMHRTETFSGFDVLMYHGYSFDYYASEVHSIRSQGGYERADLIMKFLLKRRHLAPAHKSTQYIPHLDHDPLVISTVPDFFISGHIHYSSVSNYRNVTLICGSCWQRKTAFQEKVGHHPQPCRVPLVNLKTREVKVLRFGEDE